MTTSTTALANLQYTLQCDKYKLKTGRIKLDKTGSGEVR